MGADCKRGQGSADARGVRVCARLHSQRAFHVADGDKRDLESHAALRNSERPGDSGTFGGRRAFPWADADIRRSRETAERIAKDIVTRDANTGDDFTMTVGNRTYSGKGAREEAAKALNEVILSWANDQTAQVRARFRGFEIASRGHPLGQDNDPEVYVKGALTYRAQLNPENPLGTIQSIEHVLRNLDRRAEDEKKEIQRQEKTLSDYKGQLDRPFEHEQRLKELLTKQAQLNSSLDLDKNERQVAPDDSQTEKEP